MYDTISFRCPICSAERQVPPAMLGRRASCPQCGELVEITALPIDSTLADFDQLADTVMTLGPPADELTLSDTAPPAGNEDEPKLAAAAPPPAKVDERTVTDALASSDTEEERTLADLPAAPIASPPSGPPLPPPPPPGYENPPEVEDFDPYYRWLAIPKGEQPANHYRLLGLPLFESDPDVILNSSERQMAHVKAQAGGRNLVVCQRLLSELSLARICLLDAERKAAYDKELRAKQKSQYAAAKKSGAKTGKPKAHYAIPPKSGVESRPASRFEEGPSVAAYKAAAHDAETAAMELVPLDEPVAPPVHERWKGAPEEVVREPAGDDEPPPEEVKFTRRPVEGEMDMTPMIDVTFLLLIFFICTASFALIMTKEIPAPKEDEPSTNAQTIEDFEEDPDYITIRIDAYNTFRVITADMDDEAPSYQELLLKLRAARQGGSSGKVPTSLMVIVNSQAKHKTQVMALDAGTEVGMEKMQLMTVENDDE